MAKSLIGEALGFINTITTRVMAGAKGHEEEILGLPEETIKGLADEFAQKLVLAVESATKLLKLICSIPVPLVEKFVASEAFGDKNPAGIKFWMNDNFRNNFLGKVEENVAGGELNIYNLTQASLDAPIRKELGTEEETMLAHLYEMLKKQVRGGTGDLLVNGYANIFYIRDANDNLWAVSAHWNASDREWHVYARSVTDPDGWYAGDRVVSRKSA